MIKEPDTNTLDTEALDQMAEVIMRTNRLVNDVSYGKIEKIPDWEEWKKKKMEETKVTAKTIEDEIKASIDAKTDFHTMYNKSLNAHIAVKILNLLFSEMCIGQEPNSFQQEVIALCKTQL